MISDPDRGYKSGEFCYRPDPGADCPGLSVAACQPVRDPNSEPIYGIKPGHYIGQTTVTHVDDFVVTGNEVKFFIPFYQVRHGSQAIPKDGTVAVGAVVFHDYRFEPHSATPIQALAVTVDGDPSHAQVTPAPGGTFDQWSVRLTSGASGTIQQAIASIQFADHTEEFRWYANVPSLPTETPLVTGATPNEVIDWGQEVSVTPAPADPARTLLSVGYGVVELDNADDQNIIRQLSYSNVDGDDFGAIAGIARTSAQVYGYGIFATDVTYTYSDGVVARRTIFSNPAPTPAPFQTSLTISTPSVFADGAVSGFTYSDHLNTKVSLVLEVDDGSSTTTFHLALDTRILNLPVSDHFTEGLGTYRVRVVGSFSDTSPTSSASEWANVTINAIPASTLLDDARSDFTNNVKWQAVIDSPVATDQQRAIAQSAIDFNNEIEDARTTGDPSLPQMEADRAIWISEASDTQAFDTWFEVQKDWTNPTEVAEARAWVAEAPTSSVAALLNHLGAYVAFGSAEYHLQTGSSYQINKLRDEGVPDQAILSTYAAYQANIAKGPSIFRFERYLEGDRN